MAEVSDVCPIYPRPGHGVGGVEIGLLANWYKIDMNLHKKEIYEYQVIITYDNGNKNMRKLPELKNLSSLPRPKDVKGRDVLRALFWEIVRNRRDIFGPYTEIVFDDFSCAYSLNVWNLDPRHPGFITSHPEKGKTVRIVVKRLNRFNFDMNSEDISIKNRSYSLLKNLFSQRVRYSPDQNNLQERAFARRWEALGGSIYFVPTTEGDPEVRIAPGVRAWLGSYASIKQMENSNPAVNFGLVNKLFYKPEMDLITFYCEVLEDLGILKYSDSNYESYLKDMGMNISQRLKMTAKLNGIYVKTEHALVVERGRHFSFGERIYKFIRVMDFSAKSYFIKGNTIEEIYYRLKKRLLYPSLPLCELQRGSKKDVLPLEVLYIYSKPQTCTKILDFFTKVKFIKGTCRSPHIHKTFTDAMFDMMEFDSDSNNFLRSFGCETQPRMIECSGRVLEAPTIIDKDGNNVELDSHNRSFRLKELNAPPPKTMACAVIILCSREDDALCVEKVVAKKFFNTLIEICKERNIPVSERPLFKVYEAFDDVDEVDEDDDGKAIRKRRVSVRRAVKDAKACFEQCEERKDEVLLILVFQRRIYDTYGLIKSLCDNEFGVPSQVVDEESIRKAVNASNLYNYAFFLRLKITQFRFLYFRYLIIKFYRSIYYNIALKINAKLGGVNQSAVLNRELIGAGTSNKKSQSVMYVGIDVTHPTANSGIDISIACMVANFDLEGIKYTSEIMAQMKPKETVECFDRQFSKLMFRFKRYTKSWPAHVVVFRDGVSESEMLRTAYIELKWIKDTWANLTEKDDSCRPTFTYIVIQKRHLTRFYCYPKGEEKLGNVPSGTLVDSTVVSPRMFDFYLASQFGAIGTTRPAHYTVVVDEWELTPDEIYEMSYRLCFMYARCLMPVSLPAPVYYAHLACEKAKEVYKAVQRYPGFCNTHQDLKSNIEEKLSVHESYPGMHFV